MGQEDGKSFLNSTLNGNDVSSVYNTNNNRQENKT